MQDQSPSSDPRTKAVAAAVLVGGAVFLGWFFLLPHRVPDDTHTDLSNSASELQADASAIFQQTQDAREQLDEDLAIQREAELEQQAEQQRLQDSLNASRTELEAAGHTTTVEPTE
ncbi:MAG: hypothetical protein KC925_03840 [Candidatus Doudnabacteria bacterium]|nr:hypothetical protein [Candidatus Doudnabacteria bacterium]MCA9387623.1 hypothetical protein [Candidatus Andersenbacteria bacterium]